MHVALAPCLNSDIPGQRTLGAMGLFEPAMARAHLLTVVVGVALLAGAVVTLSACAGVTPGPAATTPAATATPQATSSTPADGTGGGAPSSASPASTTAPAATATTVAAGRDDRTRPAGAVATAAVPSPSPDPASSVTPASRAPPATAAPVTPAATSPPATRAAVPQTGVRAQAASQGNAFTVSEPAEDPGVQPTPTVLEPDENEVLYTWDDGGDTRRVWLRSDLVVQPSSENTNRDAVVRDGGGESIVKSGPRHNEANSEPVFRTESSQLATLPGGVILVLDRSWDRARVDAFFAGRVIDPARVQDLTFAPNAFLVETEPGLPSLELANALAGLDGVIISSPNWRSELVLN